MIKWPDNDPLLIPASLGVQGPVQHIFALDKAQLYNIENIN